MKPFSTWTSKSQFFAASGMFALIGFAPLFVADGLSRIGFSADGFALAWGMTMGVICTLVALLCLIVSIVLSALGK